jgi:TonB family protein
MIKITYSILMLITISLLFSCSSAKEDRAKKETNTQKKVSKDYSQNEYKKENMKDDEPKIDDFIMDTKLMIDEEKSSNKVDYNEASIAGTLIIRALVDEDGFVEKCEILRCDKPEYKQAALDAVKRYKFTPAQVDGKNVKCWLTIPIYFRLKEPSE